ncbi:hypothetical protein [Nakamurella leprariae]|uniref:Uncharacterized protein n=1 Tax=Nakamurella leprariae TaxID=2803911 RepID=A0A939C0J2_9ACTN|nr:hypothetical protein [Nakamurella leprariae]MBM9466089.1 hypothetical protein [Nakamurella leprariae]
MAPPCATCTHPDLVAIDQALAAGLASGQPSLRQLGDQYGIDRASLARHRKAHLSPALKAQLTKRETAGARKVIDEVRTVLASIRGVLDRAETAQDDRTVLGAAKEMRSTLELLAKITGELDERPTVQVLNVATSPEFLAAQSAMMAALRPYPEAAQAVAAALAGVGQGQGHPPELIP